MWFNYERHRYWQNENQTLHGTRNENFQRRCLMHVYQGSENIFPLTTTKGVRQNDADT